MIAAITSVMLCCSADLFAMEIGIGPAVWYAWWQPAFENAFKGGSRPDLMQRFFYMYPSVMVGGAVTAQFAERWNFNATYLYGGWYEADTSNLKQNSPDNEYTASNLTSNKHDFDATLSYMVFGFFKVFIGFKYQGYSFEFRSESINTTTLLLREISKGSINQHSLGPGCGFGFTLDIGQGFFVLLNGSANYMRGRIQNPGGGDFYKFWEYTIFSGQMSPLPSPMC